MKKYVFLIILIALIAAIYLVISSMKETMVYYLTVSEFLKEKPEIGCRVNGKVVEGSIQHKEGTFDYAFELSDGKNVLPVIYKGAVSNMFKDGIEVVIEGKYDNEKNMFNATNILTKCPSKYEAQTEDKYKKK